MVRCAEMVEKALPDTTVIITGAASGIGRAIARACHRQGARIIANDIDQSGLDALCDELGVDTSRRIIGDVSDSDAVATMFSRLDDVGLPPQVLINNAGIAEAPERWLMLNRLAERRIHETGRGGLPKTSWDITETLSDELWRRMFQVHVEGAFFCCREAVRRMRRVGAGAIVNISSTAALTGLADAPHYAAAKAAILGFTRSLARDVGIHNVRVNAVAPGYTHTPMTDHISETVREASLAAIPMGRWAAPDEIAALVVFLASDAASYVTGQCWSANGGATM